MATCTAGLDGTFQECGNGSPFDIFGKCQAPQTFHKQAAPCKLSQFEVGGDLERYRRLMSVFLRTKVLNSCR